MNASLTLRQAEAFPLQGPKTASAGWEPRLRWPACPWQARSTTIESTLDVLDAERRRGEPSTWWLGERMGHADIALACALRFTDEVHTGLLNAQRWPELVAHLRRCEELPVFQEISQPFQVAR